MPGRTLVRPPAPLPGEVVPLEVAGMRLTLFLPPGWTEVSGRLAIHFHTADWVAVGEHLAAGYRFPLVSVFLGSGSAVYRAPFTAPWVFPELIRRVEAELHARNAAFTGVRGVDVASFSAGYGAVRELVQQPAAFALIKRIVLSDSLYGSLASGADGRGPRVVAREHVECWLPFTRAALRGGKTFVLTFSQVPTASYASTAECAAALVGALGLRAVPVSPGSLPATRVADFPLLNRCDAGRFHVWSYAGNDAAAHLTHPRHLAAVWRALEAAPGW